MKKDRIIFLEKCKEYFEANGIELSSENGKLLPLDETSYTPTWSIDILVLTKTGITSGYFRNEDNDFTITGIAPFDLYLKDVELLSNKYILCDKIKEIRKFKKGLKLK